MEKDTVYGMGETAKRSINELGKVYDQAKVPKKTKLHKSTAKKAIFIQK